MRILLLAPQPFFEIRGTPLAIRNMIRVLCGRGYSVDLITYPIGCDIEMENLRIIRIPRIIPVKEVGIGLSVRKIIFDLCLTYVASRQALHEDYDCIHGVEEAAFIAVVLGTLLKKPVVYDMDSLLSEQISATRGYAFVAPLARRIERWAVRKSALILTIGRRLADEAEKMCRTAKVAIVEDIPLDEADNEAPVHIYPAEVFEGARIITYAGSLEHYQGVDLLIKAMPAVLAAVPEARCIIIGGRKEQMRSMKALSNALGLGDSVMLLGGRDPEELKAYLTASEVLVSPRRTGDNIPYKIYTYMASGKPIVATDIGAHTAVLDEKSAFICGTDAVSLAAGLTKALTDNAEAQRRAARAERVARENYTSQSFERKLLEAYSILGPFVLRSER
ncbi:MAG: glycosyltransferase family 4 protein [bacterium]|nr:glycosyltransferase family 4 protein [bacterium]